VIKCQKHSKNTITMMGAGSVSTAEKYLASRIFDQLVKSAKI
jgi:hypothetical protein